MNRAQLSSALRESCAAAGYDFATAADEYMPRSIGSFPAAWLSPPLLHSVEGRRHGRVTYDVTLHLLASAAKLPLEKRNELWDKMERDALDIFAALSLDDCVVAVEKLEIVPRTYALTSHGEISQTATARVITFF